MTYEDYLNFCHDFGMSNMHAGTRHEFAESFLASCQSSGLPLILDNDGIFRILSFDDVLMVRNEDDEEEIDGFLVPTACLHFNRFLEAVGRFALAVFCDVYPQKPPKELVGCMLCEIGRSLQRSNITKIISRRGCSNRSTYPATLMRGVKKFQIEILKFYRDNDENGKMSRTIEREITQAERGGSAADQKQYVKSGTPFKIHTTMHRTPFTSPTKSTTCNSPEHFVSPRIGGAIRELETKSETYENSEDVGDEDVIDSEKNQSTVGTTKQDIVSLQLFIALNGFRNDVSGEMDEQTVLNLKTLLSTSKHVLAMLKEENLPMISLHSGLLDVPTIRALQRHLNRELHERFKMMGTNNPSQMEEDGRWTLALANMLREYLGTHSQQRSLIEKRSTKKANDNNVRNNTSLHRGRRKEHELDMEDSIFSENEGALNAEELDLTTAETYLSSHAISFLKYGRRGRPKVRAFWLDDEESDWYIRWCEVGQRTRKGKSKRCVRIADIVDIRSGRKTDVFNRFKGQGKSDCSFSLITKERTIDLEAESEILRNRWIHAMSTVLAEMKER